MTALVYSAAGCDTDEERRRLFAEKGKVPVYADAAEMIREHAPHILIIATHPDSHFYYCRLAASCGVPVVVCEKPLADTRREACKIAALAACCTCGFLPQKQRKNPDLEAPYGVCKVQKNSLISNFFVYAPKRNKLLEKAAHGKTLTIITNHERRYSEDYIRAKNILAGETLGRLLAVRAVLYMGKTKRLLDVLWHDGTHLADAIMFLTGSTLKHRRRFGAKLAARTGTAWLLGTLHGGKTSPPVPVVIELGAGRDHLVFEIEFSCEQGRLHIGNGIFEVWESAPSPYAEQFRSLKQTAEKFDDPTGYFANMIQDAVDCAKEPEKRPRSSAADGLRVIEYLNSVQAWR